MLNYMVGSQLGLIYHVVWLQQIENDSGNWNHSEAKLEFHHALVWHIAQPTVMHERVAPAAALAEGASKGDQDYLHPSQARHSCLCCLQGVDFSDQDQYLKDCHICAYTVWPQ